MSKYFKVLSFLKKAHNVFYEKPWFDYGSGSGKKNEPNPNFPNFFVALLQCVFNNKKYKFRYEYPLEDQNGQFFTFR